MDRVVVVSNRLPLTLRRVRDGWRADRSAGGLATAVFPILRQTRGVWVGWPGDDPPAQPDPQRAELLERWASREGLVAIDMPSGVAKRFYEGYANQTLWPLFHNFPSRLSFDPAGWDAYVEANSRFRDAVLRVVQPKDLIWIHDYHLMLLPQMLREALPDARIGFFLHIPFPASEIFRLLPRRDELLHGLLGNDLIAFQTHAHLQNFRRSMLRVLGIASQMDQVVHAGRTIALEGLPIGIAPEEFTGPLATDPQVETRLAELKRRFEGRRLLLAVDRLDYTKGIPERLRAFRRLLHSQPGLRGKVVLLQVAVPSRERLPRYAELRREVNELVGAINGEYGTPEWTPVVYLRRGMSRAEIVALYAASVLGWIAPLRDGMNLVAKEYVACQADDDAVLILSEFAGAAAEMGEAFLVNPYDEERTAHTVAKALALPLEERTERMSALRRRVLRNNAYAWAGRFLGLLARAVEGRHPLHGHEPPPLPVDEVVADFARSERRWILLDYDGTLVPFAGRPRDATPSEGLIERVRALARPDAHRVALVSGRPREDLARWFGDVPGLWLAAEHGAVVRAPGSDRWEMLRAAALPGWKDRVRPVLEHFVDRTPGSFLEEKELSLVWHHRLSDPEFGDWLANELVATLEEMLVDTELCAARGHKSVEVKLAWANKGEAYVRLAERWPEATFRLGIGDDRTDEDLFERMGSECWTAHVGQGSSRARYSLKGPADVRELLDRLVSARTERPA